MSTQRGLLLLTIPPEAADRFDHLAKTFELTPEQVAIASVAVLSSMIEARDARAVRFMGMVRSDAHRSLDAQLTTHYRGAG